MPNRRPAANPIAPALTVRSGLLLLVILSLFAVAPLLYPGFIETHSGYVPLWNIIDLRQNWGQPGWLPHLATDFNALRSDGLLLYYVAALLPLPPPAALKLIAGAAWLWGGVGIFLWLRSWLGQTGALVAALVYVYLPCQIATVYVRGAWGESLFWGLLPWAILTATFLVTSPRIYLLPIAALFWLLLGLTQLGLTLWAMLFTAALLLVVHWRQSLLPLLSMLAGTILAALVYLLLRPAAFAAPATIVPADHVLYPFQLFSAAWGFGPSRPGWNDGLSLQLGLAALGLTIINVAVWQRTSTHRPDRRLRFFLLAALALSLAMLLPVLWSIPGLSATLSYPWQLLGLTGLCLAVLAGSLPWLEPRFERLPLLAALVILIILSVYPYLLPKFTPVTPAMTRPPRAELGRHQLALLDDSFAVRTSGHTVGLEQGQTAIPLAAAGPLRPGQTLLLRVDWQPLQAIDRNLKVFVHLVDAGDNVLAQFDGYPQGGDYPTPQWRPGEIIADTYPIALPASAPPGPYRLFLGLYDETTLERLPVPTDTAGRVILDVR
jgi:hypothetical protein